MYASSTLTLNNGSKALFQAVLIRRTHVTGQFAIRLSNTGHVNTYRMLKALRQLKHGCGGTNKGAQTVESTPTVHAQSSQAAV